MFPFHHAAWRAETERPDGIGQAVVALPQRREAFGSSLELAPRFATALKLKQDKKHPMPKRRTTKNCASARRRLAQSRSRHQAELDASIATLRDHIAALEQSRSLADAHVLLWRTNRTGAAVDVCREYFVQFAQGYDATAPRRNAICSFMYAVADDNLVCREYRGVDKLLAQWEIYTTFHSDLRCRLCDIALVDEEDDVVSIRCLAELDLGISDATLQYLYPAFYAQSQRNDQSRRIADGLVGKRYTIAFDKVLHFNRHGKIVAHESKVHLASGLVALVEDPFAALEVLQASVMTADGHWQTSDVDYMRVEQEDMYEMPKVMLC